MSMKCGNCGNIHNELAGPCNICGSAIVTGQKTKLDDTKPVDVIFRKWRKGNGGDVIALFPGLASTIGKPNECESFMHADQHGGASVDVVHDTRLATPTEYIDLQRELEGRGYKLRIIKRMTRHHTAQRIAQLKR